MLGAVVFSWISFFFYFSSSYYADDNESRLNPRFEDECRHNMRLKQPERRVSRWETISDAFFSKNIWNTQIEIEEKIESAKFQHSFGMAWEKKKFEWKCLNETLS